MSSFLYFSLANVTIHMAKWICSDKRGNGFTCMIGPLIEPSWSEGVEKGAKTTLRGRTHQDGVYFSYGFINYHAPENPKIITCHATRRCGGAEPLVKNVSVYSVLTVGSAQWFAERARTRASGVRVGVEPRLVGNRSLNILHRNWLNAIKPWN